MSKKAVVKNPLPEKLPKLLYIILENRDNYQHSGRSQYAQKINGYRFAQGSVVVLNHPEDILYFISKKDQFTWLAMYFKWNTKWKTTKHRIDRYADASLIDPAKAKDTSRAGIITNMLANTQARYTKLRAKYDVVVDPVDEEVVE